MSMCHEQKLFKVCESLRKTDNKTFFLYVFISFFCLKYLESMSKKKKVNYSYITINKDQH
jgi:hypothetical protein